MKNYYELGWRWDERLLDEISLISVDKRCRLLKFALELQILRKVADHVNLLLQIVQILLLLNKATIVVATDVQAKRGKVVVRWIGVEILA
jgi:hypothetical protein